MAKNDLFSGLAATVEQDERTGEFYRPAAPSKAPAARPRGAAPGPPEPHSWPRPSDAGGEEEPFLRSRRRVPVRRGIVPKTRTWRIVFAAVAVLAVALPVVLVLSVRDFLRENSRFRIQSASSIQIAGNSEVSRPELLSVFGSDIGRNIFFVPLTERRAQLESLPWVAQATVMRFLPNQLRVSIVERKPIAFIREGNAIKLVDAFGVALSMTPGMIATRHYSFPVITGITARDPLPVRAARMHLYQQFIGSLDSGGKKVSAQLSEVDLSDPEDVRVIMPARGTGILVHFGESDFLARYQSYQQHLAQWQQQYPHLASVDLRYDGQVVLGMAGGSDSGGAAASQGKAARTLPGNPRARGKSSHTGKRAGGRRAPAHSTRSQG